MSSVDMEIYYFALPSPLTPNQYTKRINNISFTLTECISISMDLFTEKIFSFCSQRLSFRCVYYYNKTMFKCT